MKKDEKSKKNRIIALAMAQQELQDVNGGLLLADATMHKPQWPGETCTNNVDCD